MSGKKTDIKIINPLTGYKINVSGKTAEKLYRQYIQDGSNITFKSSQDLKLLESQFKKKWNVEKDVEKVKVEKKVKVDKKVKGDKKVKVEKKVEEKPLPTLPDDILDIIIKKNVKTLQDVSVLKAVSKKFGEKCTTDIKQLAKNIDINRFMQSYRKYTPKQLNNLNDNKNVIQQFYYTLYFSKKNIENEIKNFQEEYFDKVLFFDDNPIKTESLLLASMKKRKYDLDKVKQWCLLEIIIKMFAKTSDYISDDDDDGDSDDDDNGSSECAQFNTDIKKTWNGIRIVIAFSFVQTNLRSNLSQIKDKFFQPENKYEKTLKTVDSLTCDMTLGKILDELDKLPLVILLLMTHHYDE